MSKAVMNDMVVLLPGITGSVLRRHGKDLWNLSARTAWSAAISLGESVREIRLAGDPDLDADRAPDGVEATGLIEDYALVPGLYKIDGYSMLPGAILESFEIAEVGPDDAEAGNFVKFPYDWRRDVRASARRLKRVVDRKLDLWRRGGGGTSGSRVILVAHSMGGLVSQYYLEALEGWSDCRALITFGTPYRGSVQALEYLVNGFKKLRIDLTEAMRSFPSSYQLMPRYPFILTEEGGRPRRVRELAERLGLDPAGLRAHVELHDELDAAWERHKGDARYQAEGYLTIPVVGTRQTTRLSATWDGARLATAQTLPPGQEGMPEAGDGTVPQVSAIPLTQSNQKEFRGYFVAEQHGSLQNQAFVISDLMARLTFLQSANLEGVRGQLVPQSLGGTLVVEVDDAYREGEPVVLAASAPDAEAGERPGLVARVERADGGFSAIRTLAAGEGGMASTTLTGLSPGIYRVEVGAEGKAAAHFLPVHSIFAVDGDEGGGGSPQGRP